MCLQAALTITFIVVGGGFRSLINFAVVGACETIMFLFEFFRGFDYRYLSGMPALLRLSYSFLGILFPHGTRNNKLPLYSFPADAYTMLRRRRS